MLFRLVDICQHFEGKICCLSIQVEESYTLKMESAGFCETFVNICNATRQHSQEYSKFQLNADLKISGITYKSFNLIRNVDP